MEVTIIRKVELSMDEQKKYEVIKSLADHPAPNKQRAALSLTYVFILGFLKLFSIFSRWDTLIPVCSANISLDSFLSALNLRIVSPIISLCMFFPPDFVFILIKFFYKGSRHITACFLFPSSLFNIGCENLIYSFWS